MALRSYQMKGNPLKFNVNLISQFGKAIAAILAGSILVHIIVMTIDFYLVGAPLRFSLETEMGAYGFFSLLVYILWKKLKGAMILACEREIQCERDRETIESLQRITGLLAEYISGHNAEILRWVEYQKGKGRQVSQRVEEASRKISHALASLSEIAYVYPFGDHPSGYLDELEDALKDRLGKEASGGKGSQEPHGRNPGGSDTPSLLAG
jgi:hypothetical protein